MLLGDAPGIGDERKDVLGLFLNDNQLSGEIPPELGNLGSQNSSANFAYVDSYGYHYYLPKLHLQNNLLTGEIPLEMERPWHTRDLTGNQFSGCVSDYFAKPTFREYRDRDSVGVPECEAVSDPDDQEALVAIYQAVVGNSDLPNWQGWLGRDPMSQWNGVDTDREGRVVKLTLQLNGKEIPPELGNLVNLRELYISDTRGEIPPELGKLSNLEYLDLSNNWLSGEIPPELGNLVNLTVNFRGTALCKSSAEAVVGYANLCHERELLLPVLDKNVYEGPLMLRDIGSWRWTGSSRWPRRDGNRGLGVGTNSEGHVTGLSIRYGRGHGEIPPELGSLVNLTTLTVHSVNGEIPPELGNLVNLTYLELNFENSRANLTGEIPPELGNLVNLTTLSLRSNRLSGGLPPELGNLVNLTTLNLGDNWLTGEIPAELGSLVNLTSLSLHENQLSGCVPGSLEGRLGGVSDLGGLPFC